MRATAVLVARLPPESLQTALHQHIHIHHLISRKIATVSPADEPSFLHEAVASASPSAQLSELLHECSLARGALPFASHTSPKNCEWMHQTGTLNYFQI